MPIEVKKSVEIPVKRYSGAIMKTEITDAQNEAGETVQYVNFYVQTDAKVEGWNGQFKLSCPAYLTRQSQLGRFLTRLKVPYTPGENFDERSLEGMKIAFDTVRKGYFTNPVMDSAALVNA